MFLLLQAALCQDWAPVQALMEEALRNRTFSGAVLSVGAHNQTYFTLPFGSVAHGNGLYQQPVTGDSLFDLASLTKITATTMCVMRLVDEKRLKVDELVTKYMPDYDNNLKRNTTIRNLLLHNAGLPADPPASLKGSEVLQWAINCKLVYPLGSQYLYSDLSFILLGHIVELITNKTLDKYALQVNIGMGLRNTRFNIPAAEQRLALATEYTLDRGLVQGLVHDQNSFKMGGVAGHAGLFSTAADVMTMMRIMLNNGTPWQAKNPQFSKETVQTFIKKEEGLPYANSRALGWDTVPIQANPPCGHKFSKNSFGHTGFTGTSAWADMEKDLAIVLLTNAVHPSRNLKSDIIQFRARLSDAVVTALGF